MMDNSGEWKTIPTKEQKNKEYQMKKKKKEEDLQKKRDIEKKEYEEKQRKIKELFDDSSKAFKNNKYSSHWEVLEEDVDDSEFSSPKFSKKQKPQHKADNGFEFVNQFETQKKKDAASKKQQKQKNQIKSSNSTAKSIQPPKSLENAFDSFNIQAYSDLLNTIDSKFQMVDLQMKVIAEKLEEHFGQLTNENVNNSFDNRIDYISLFKNSFKKDTMKYFESKQQSNLVPSISFLLNNLISIYKKDKNAVPSSGVGLEILLQFIFRFYPDNLIKMKDSFKSMNLSNQKLNVLNLILWFFIQPINQRAKVTNQLWYELIFPLLLDSPRLQISEAHIMVLDDFSEAVFNHPKTKNHIVLPSEVLIQTTENFLHKLQNSKIPPIALKFSYVLFEIELLFPNGHVPEKYYQALLNNAAISDPDFRDKILLELVKCLRVDQECFTYTSKSYSDYIAPVNNLLLFINDKWDELHLYTNIPKSKVRSLAEFAMEENNKLMNSPSIRKEKKITMGDLEMCNKTSTMIIEKFSGSSVSGRVKNLVVFVGLPLIGLGIYYLKTYVCPNQNQYPSQFQPYLKSIC